MERRADLCLRIIYRRRGLSFLVAVGWLNSKGRAVASRVKTGRGLTTVPMQCRQPPQAQARLHKHQPVLHGGPGETVLYQPLAGNHQAGAVPIQQLQPIRLPGPEPDDRRSERILAQRVFYHPARLSWPLRKSMGFVATMIRTRFDGKIMSRPRRHGR